MNMEMVEVPETITVKFETKKTEKDFLDILKCLYIEDRNELPFKLPRLVSWPRGKKAVSERAALLLKNGYYDLIEKRTKSSGASVGNGTSSVDEEEAVKKFDEDGFNPSSTFSNVNEKLVI